MSYVDALSRISALQAQVAELRSGQLPSAAGVNQGSGAVAAPSAPGDPRLLSHGVMQSSAATGAGSFGAYLTQAVSGSGLVGAPGSNLAASGAAAALPAAAGTMLTSAQQGFASRLAADTGLSPSVVSAWMLAEESGGAAVGRQNAGNNDWLNIGYTDSGTFGSGDSVWSDPLKAADATAGWLRGQNTVPGYGTASSGIQSIAATAGQPVATQVAAIQGSGWASSGYPDLPGLVSQLGG